MRNLIVKQVDAFTTHPFGGNPAGIITNGDGLRPEDEAQAAFLDEWIRRDFHALGYSVVRVPVMPPEERLAFVLERVSEGG